MGVKIKLINNYYLLSDSRQWILGKKLNSGLIKHLEFYDDLNKVPAGLIWRCLKQSNAKTMKRLASQLKSLCVALRRCENLVCNISITTKINESHK